MAGVEEKLGKDVYISDETEGIIPRVLLFFCIINKGIQVFMAINGPKG